MRETLGAALGAAPSARSVGSCSGEPVPAVSRGGRVVEQAAKATACGCGFRSITGAEQVGNRTDRSTEMFADRLEQLLDRIDSHLRSPVSQRQCSSAPFDR